MTKVIIVRHAEADGNFNHTFQGRTDASITENGKKQLEQLKERFKNVEYDKIYSSPLKRTLATAKAVNFYHGLEITTVQNLIEIDGGHWEGVKWDDIPNLYPKEHHDWLEEPYNFNPECGESMKHVYSRIYNAIIDLVKENKNKTIIVVSHGCAIRNLVCKLRGLPIEKLCDIPWLENTSVTTAHFDNDLNSNVIGFNDYSHLTYETATLQKQDWWKKIKGSEK